MDREALEKYLEQIFKSKEGQSRDIMLSTGRGGAIEEEIQFRLLISKRSEEEIREEVESLVWEVGVYQTNPETGRLEYKGLWDQTMPDCTIITKRHGVCYLEHWRSGYRAKYDIITEKQFEELKLQSNETKDI